MIKRLILGWRPRWFWWLRDNRPAYCDKCGAWTWTRSQPVNRSVVVARLCYEDAEDEAAECEAAWAEYYSGLL